jgi:hypothetical protein
MALTKATNSMIAGSTVNALDYGIDITGATDSSAALQAAIDAAIAQAETGASGRASVVCPQGSNIKISANVQLKTVALDATGVVFLLTSNAGFLVGGDCAFVSGATRIECEAGWDGVVFKRDPALSGAVGKLNMVGRPFIVKNGALDKTTGIVVDMTGLLASSLDFQSYNFEIGLFANTTTSSDQTYYNRVAARITGVDYGIRLRTNGFQGINGNSFSDISIGDCNIGIELIEGVAGFGGGPSANSFYINYIEKCATYGIHLNGEVWHNTFIGGIIEPQNDVICIRNAGGKYNTFDMNVVPPSGNKGLESILGAARNNYFLRRFGTFITWSNDIGPSAAYSTGTTTKTYIGNTVSAGHVTHNSATPTVSLASGVRTVVLSGAGTITGIDSAALTEVESVVFVGNGSATIQNNAAVTYPFRVTGGANVTPPAEARITFQRIPGISNSWWEESRSW